MFYLTLYVDTAKQITFQFIISIRLVQYNKDLGPIFSPTNIYSGVCKLWCGYGLWHIYGDQFLQRRARTAKCSNYEWKQAWSCIEFVRRTLQDSTQSKTGKCTCIIKPWLLFENLPNFGDVKNSEKCPRCCCCCKLKVFPSFYSGANLLRNRCFL